MSHEAVRILADWFKDTTYGVNAVAASVPRDAGDPAPPTVTIYDETRDGWVARRQVPQPTGKVVLPAVIVFLQSATFDGGVAASAEAARTISGTVQVVAQLVMDVSATEAAIAAGMYLLRAMRNSALQLDEGENEDARTLAGVRLDPSTDCKQGRIDAPVSDAILSLGALVLTYDTIETTALTLPM